MHSSPRFLTRLGRLAAVGFLGARALTAQLPHTDAAAVLRRIEIAIETTDYRAMQVRRVRGNFVGHGRGSDEWVGAIESILHRGAAGSQGDCFSIELRGIEGRSMSALELMQRQQIYRGQVDYLFRFQGFRVFDEQLAARQYSLHVLGAGPLRAQRPCNRLALVSRTPDRPSWLLDLDAVKSFPLYAAQFTPTGRLVAELEVTSISYDAAASVPPDNSWAWTPRMGVEEFATFEQAATRTQSVAALRLSTADIGTGQVAESARVITNPLTGEQSLVQIFHDGIDTVFVTQRACAPLQSQTHTARFYSDAGVYQCSFQHKSTEFLVVGRNANLRDMAIRIHQLAVSRL